MELSGFSQRRDVEIQELPRPFPRDVSENSPGVRWGVTCSSRIIVHACVTRCLGILSCELRSDSRVNCRTIRAN